MIRVWETAYIIKSCKALWNCRIHNSFIALSREVAFVYHKTRQNITPSSLILVVSSIYFTNPMKDFYDFMMCFRLDIRLVSSYMFSLLSVLITNICIQCNHSLILHVSFCYSILMSLGTIFCDVFSLDICLIFLLHVFVHTYNQFNYVSTGINHWFYMLYSTCFILFYIILYWHVLYLTCTVDLWNVK
jgi:hypothetical protein